MFETPTKEEALARPESLSTLGQKAHKAITNVLAKYASPDRGSLDDPGGCKTFYSPEEWQARGEAYGLTSELVVVYDGGGPRHFFEWEGRNESLLEEMRLALEADGLYHECCTCWYGAIYEL